MRWLAIRVIRTYRYLISPFLAPCCRFYPSCSRYAEEAISKYGLWRGVLKSAWRLCRCHPYNPGGYDPVQ